MTGFGKTARIPFNHGTETGTFPHPPGSTSGESAGPRPHPNRFGIRPKLCFRKGLARRYPADHVPRGVFRTERKHLILLNYGNRYNPSVSRSHQGGIEKPRAGGWPPAALLSYNFHYSLGDGITSHSLAAGSSFLLCFGYSLFSQLFRKRE
ncbi:hypothetical protein CEXT_287391 [Caerostris extrusa]|uniref:Uncharacterized protein n=1 Tax=Caerostris extrusa TaxID=172846 RepID=A0AAV4PXC5_CAEEX|nr:hypothetical protein CEXT_287391 [Caerostris extrusa]